MSPMYSRPADPCLSPDALLRCRNGYASPEEEAALKAHLDRCAECRADYESTEVLSLELVVAETDRQALSRFLPTPEHAAVCLALAKQLDTIARSPAPPAEEVLDHLDSCPYCRCRLLLIEKDESRGRRSLRRALLDALLGEALNKASLTVMNARRVAAVAAEREEPGEPPPSRALIDVIEACAGEIDAQFLAGTGILALDGLLLDGLRQAMVTPLEHRGKAVEAVLSRHDRLYFVAAGEEGNPIRTRPLWFTYLDAFPERLWWGADESEGPWHVALWDAWGEHLFAETAVRPEIRLPTAVAERIEPDFDVSWEVRRGEPSGSAVVSAVVSGVFRLLPKSRAADVARHLGEMGSLPPGITRDLAIAKCWYDGGLYEAALLHLEELRDRCPHRAFSFLVHRALAAVLVAVRRELTGPRNLGHREGLWAAKLSNEALAAGYAAIGLPFPSA